MNSDRNKLSPPIPLIRVRYKSLILALIGIRSRLRMCIKVTTPPKAKFGDFANEEKKYPSHGYRVLGNQVEIKVRDSKDCTVASRLKNPALSAP